MMNRLLSPSSLFLRTDLPTTAGSFQSDFLRVGPPQRPAKRYKSSHRTPNGRGVLRRQMAKVELEEEFCEVGCSSTGCFLLPHSFLNVLHYPVLNALMSMGLAVNLLIVQGYRYKRVSDAAQRQQTKWVLLGMVVAFGGYGVFLLLEALLPSVLVASVLGNTAFFALMLLIPISIAVAVLRYRLYEIDLLINRTLVYGALTALLVTVYVGTILVIQGLFRTLAGQESQLAIVVSTLAGAAVFSPLRRRIQAFIDRRFYRRKYDAAKTLEVFSAKLRDETDLDTLSDDLVGVVRETMQPAHVSLWLRPDTASKGKHSD
jgi:hypothetical protein